MYHPGRILEVIKPNEHEPNVQAVVKMWDRHIFTLNVSKEVSKKLKSGDVVLVDYRLSPNSPPHPRRVIIKILGREEGKRVLEHYEKYYGNNVKKIYTPQPTYEGIG